MCNKKIYIILFISSLLLASNYRYDFSNTSLNGWKTNAQWNIINENGNARLSLLKRAHAPYNLCYTTKVNFLNGTINVNFRSNRGKMDQGGGIMWRVQNNLNYYVMRFNPLEDNFRIYIVHDGVRTQLASADVTLSSGWHNMKIVQNNNNFQGYIDNKKYIQSTNNMLKKAGGVGVWTKSDALTSFDNLNIDN